MDTIMMGHAFYPQIDNSGLSSSLSPVFIKDLLRKEWGFKGAVMTDDLDMGAIVHRYGLEDSIRLSLEAGNDFVLICHRTQMARAAYQTLAAMKPQQLEEPLSRILNYKKKLSPPTAFSESRHLEIDAKIYQLRSEVVGPELARQKSPENAKRSPVEDF
jgi:beta-N-acetylhexosaminidase